jgi:uncharacterized protein (DUF2141 family)
MSIELRPGCDRDGAAPSAGSRRLAAAMLLVVMASSAPSDAATDVISVPILGLKSDQGQVICELFASEDGFPAKSEKAAALRTVKIASKSATCVFDGVKPGSYAIAAMHDENGNGKLDKNFIGIPTEGVGASRDARGRMGPPKWKDAVFSFAGGAIPVAITIHY